MSNKIWYTFPNNKPYPILDNVIKVDDSNSSKYITEIKQSIDLFNSNIEWEDMWDLEQAGKRFSQGSILFLLRDNKGALGHVWFENDYLYNLFVSPTAIKGESQRFIEYCISEIKEETIHCYCDSWNIRAQKFFERVGFKKDFSYL